MAPRREGKKALLRGRKDQKATGATTAAARLPPKQKQLGRLAARCSRRPSGAEPSAAAPAAAAPLRPPGAPTRPPPPGARPDPPPRAPGPAAAPRDAPAADTHLSAPRHPRTPGTRHPAGVGAAPSPRHFRVCPGLCSKQTVPPPPPCDAATGPESSGWRSRPAPLADSEETSGPRHLPTPPPSSGWDPALGSAGGREGGDRRGGDVGSGERAPDR